MKQLNMRFMSSINRLWIAKKLFQILRFSCGIKAVKNKLFRIAKEILLVIEKFDLLHKIIFSKHKFNVYDEF